MHDENDSAPPSDVLVLFGATGDLAHKMIFPALYAMVKRGALTVPVIGVAHSGWDLEQLRDRVTRQHRASSRAASTTKRLSTACSRLLGYVDGDYNDPATFAALRRALGQGAAPGASTSRSRPRSSRR